LCACTARQQPDLGGGHATSRHSPQHHLDQPQPHLLGPPASPAPH
jgi:hypothetical protein